MHIPLEQIGDIAKIATPVIAIVAGLYKVFKCLYAISVSVDKVLSQQDGQLSMHKGLQEALNEIKGIKLVCAERHRWDGVTDRRKLKPDLEDK